MTSPAALAADVRRPDRDPAWAMFGTMVVRDTSIALHAVRSTALATAIAHEAGLSVTEPAFWGFLLHDVGMLKIPTELLHSPVRFGREQHNVVANHPVMSAQVLAGLAEKIDRLEEAVPIVLRHHERWDGTGYPSGISDWEIPLPGRLLAVADVFAALTAPRPYRVAHTSEEAIDLIVEQSGSAFDPVIVNALEGLLPHLPVSLVVAPELREVLDLFGPRIAEHAERGQDLHGAQVEALFGAALGLEASEAASRLGRSAGTQRTWTASLRRILAVPHRVPLRRFLSTLGRDAYASLDPARLKRTLDKAL